MNFESFFKEVIEKNPELKITILRENTTSYDDIDYILKFNDTEIPFGIDCKEKKSKNRQVWSDISNIDRNDIFIFDELGIKKIFKLYPFGFFIIFDDTENKYYLFSCLDLLTIQKSRVNRPIYKKQSMMKGKWIIDLKQGKKFENLIDLMNNLRDYLKKTFQEDIDRIDCYGDVITMDDKYTRTQQYWEKDVTEK